MFCFINFCASTISVIQFRRYRSSSRNTSIVSKLSVQTSAMLFMKTFSSRHSWCHRDIMVTNIVTNIVFPDSLTDRLDGNIWKWQSGNIYFHPNWLARGQCKAMEPIIGFPTQQIVNFNSIYVMFNVEIEMGALTFSLLAGISITFYDFAVNFGER